MDYSFNETTNQLTIILEADEPTLTEKELTHAARLTVPDHIVIDRLVERTEEEVIYKAYCDHEIHYRATSVIKASENRTGATDHQEIKEVDMRTASIECLYCSKTHHDVITDDWGKINNILGE